MSRPSLRLALEHFRLESRLLQASRVAQPALAAMLPNVGFAGSPMVGQPLVALQQDGTASIRLFQTSVRSPVQDEVDSDPTSSAVGVQVAAVHQIVTIAPGTQPDPLIVPIIAGAPNPGSVDVTLTMTPIDPPPGFTVGPPMHLKVLASKDLFPPMVTKAQGTVRGLAVTFSKAMDPAGVADPRNYTVKGSQQVSYIGGWSGPMPPAVRVRSVTYDPTTQTATLQTQPRLNFKTFDFLISMGRRAKSSRRSHPHADPVPTITDRLGQPIADGVGSGISLTMGVEPPD